MCFNASNVVWYRAIFSNTSIIKKLIVITFSMYTELIYLLGGYNGIPDQRRGYHASQVKQGTCCEYVFISYLSQELVSFLS